MRPTAGAAWIGAHEVWRERVAVKRLIGVVPQKPNLDFALTAREILTFTRRTSASPRRSAPARAADLLDRFKLADRADQMVHGFSGGMMQRLSIARALMHDPAGAVPRRAEHRASTRRRACCSGSSSATSTATATPILLTTHNMEEADALCDRLAIVDHGRVIAIGHAAGAEALGAGRVRRAPRLRPRRPTGCARRSARFAGVTEVQAPPDGGVDLYADHGGTLIPHIVAAAAAAGATIHDVHISEPSLENLFLHHTGRSLRE